MSTDVKHADVDLLIDSLATGLRDHLAGNGINNAVMVGIHSGGVWVAERLYSILQLDEGLGSLDIAFYRDDFTRIGVHPQVKPSSLPFDIDGRHVVLIDDVLYTGRTIRAAMNELFDYARPASVTLAVLVDRGGRELPIQADVTALKMRLGEGEQIKLTGPEPLQLERQKTAVGAD